MLNGADPNYLSADAGDDKLRRSRGEIAGGQTTALEQGTNFLSVLTRCSSQDNIAKISTHFDDSVSFLMTVQSVPVTIYHNPACGTSRNTLALIRNAGVEPTVIEYLKMPPDRITLVGLLNRMGMRPRELLRDKGTPFAELGLAAEHWSDEQLIDQMLAHPILINRPIVVTPWGVKLCRPSELVLEILPLPQKGAFVKEDGERVVDETGKRIR